MATDTEPSPSTVDSLVAASPTADVLDVIHGRVLGDLGNRLAFLDRAEVRDAAEDVMAVLREAVEAGELIRADQLERVGWMRWDGDEFFDFRYKASGEDRRPTPTGYMPVYVQCPEI